MEEINRSPQLLPNHTLGYTIYDSCAYPLTGQRAALAVLNGLIDSTAPICNKTSPLLAVIGESGSAQSIVVSRILQPFKIPMVITVFVANLKNERFSKHFIIFYSFPQILSVLTLKISYFSSCACLSDRRKYPTFFRVIPNDDYQVRVFEKFSASSTHNSIIPFVFSEKVACNPSIIYYRFSRTQHC